LHVVINYDYSQRNHKSPWLLVDVGMASTRRFVLSRDNISITTPAGRTVPVARQEALNSDAPGVTLVLQNAKIFRRPIATYFSQRNSLLEEMKFQVAPPGTTTVSSEAIVDNDRLTLGGLLFRNPEGSWPSGTYRFAVEHEVAKAALPIVLE
jgi:hypothetical protein